MITMRIRDLLFTAAVIAVGLWLIGFMMEGMIALVFQIKQVMGQ